MTFYQVEITLFKYNWLTGKWGIKETFRSPIIHESYGEADMFQHKWRKILASRGWIFKEGHYQYSIHEVHYEPRPKYEPNPELLEK